jgi:hypothetical protein
LFFKFWTGGAAARKVEPSFQFDADIDADVLLKATEDFTQLFYAAYTDEDDNSLHAETVIGGAAALTGEFVLRATSAPLPDAGFVFSDLIDDMLYRARDRVTIYNVLETVTVTTPLKSQDVPDPNQLVRRISQGVAEAMKGDCNNFPPLTISPENYPQEWSPNAGLRLRYRVLEIERKHHLTERQTAFALAYATVGIIKYVQGVLDPAIATRLAAEIMFATARMVPLTDPI